MHSLPSSDESDAELAGHVLRFVEQLPHLVGITDDVGHVRWLNRVGRIWLGLDPDAPLPALTTGDLFTDDVFDRYYAEIRPTILGGEAWSGRLTARRADGEAGAVDAVVIGGTGPGGEITWLGTCAIDIRDQLEREEELAHRASHDPLTGLPNRLLFEARLDLALSVAHRTRSPVAVVALDLDQFKTVNDTYGHAAGDQLLVQVTERLRASVRPADTTARLGGDEFVVVVYPPESAAAAVTVARRIHASLSQLPYVLDAATVELTASVGVAVGLPGNDFSPSELTGAADRGMYRAKRRGGNRVEVVDPSGQGDLGRVDRIGAELSRALSSGEFDVGFDPVADIESGHIVTVEAVPRWHHPDRGMLEHEQFAGDAAASGFDDLLAWATARRALQAAADLPAGVSLDLPLPATAVRNPDLGDMLAELREAFPGVDFRIQWSERGFTGVQADVIETVVETLGALGIRIVLADHGAGSVPLSTVAELPLAAVRLDPALHDGLRSRPKAMALATKIGPVVGVEVIAPEVADRADLALLRVLGVGAVTGPLTGPRRRPDELGSLTPVDWTVAGKPDDEAGRRETESARRIGQV